MSQNTPKVTVGIPAYNAERFIGWAIKSVLNQTYTDFELIITDDGSTDKTVEIARSFNDPRIKLISDGQNHGISYRLNQQIDLAQGEYFVRMDADDIMLPDRIEKQVEYLAEHPEVDIIGGDVIVIDDDNKIIGCRTTEFKTPFDFQLWMNGGTFNHPTVTGKTSIFRKFKYSTDFTGVEDRHLWMRATQTAKLVILPQYYMFYRDPLNFKLKTYLFRCRQNRKLLKLPIVRKKFGWPRLIKQLFLSYSRSFIAIGLTCCHKDSIMIARRNKGFKDSNGISQILFKLISHN